MKILIDENIPHAYKLFSKTGKVILIPGRQIPPDLLDIADALLVRSVTRVDATLLEGKNIKFVGTTTAGTDHIDEKFLRNHGICFASAPGCNAIAVAEYVISAILALAERDNFSIKDRIIGIIGVGNVGYCLHQKLLVLGVRTILCDPPLAARIEKGIFCSLSLKEVLSQAEILTLHTPLSTQGPWKTRYLFNSTLLSSLKPNSILINASRGPVVENSALLELLTNRNDLSIVLDVWENEPALSLALLDKVDIGTAHIAGYTLEGRIRGTIQILVALRHFLEQPPQLVAFNRLLPIAQINYIRLNGILNQVTLTRLVHLVYDIRYDDALLRNTVQNKDGFDFLRKNYRERREWSSLYIQCDNANTASILKNLGFNAFYEINASSQKKWKNFPEYSELST
ncbi:MAG: 4-phosphoerythronate dehydrogenase [Candidatus Dasytiphilus stammeri]